MKVKKTIYRVGNGWYNFENVPQGFVKICNLACGTDIKALNQAKRMNSNCEYEIKTMEN